MQFLEFDYFTDVSATGSPRIVSGCDCEPRATQFCLLAARSGFLHRS